MATAANDRESVDFARLMPVVATRLLGNPNQRLSRGARLRFGSKGSMEVDTAEGWFDDHEADIRGGVLQLIQHKVGCDTAGAFRWLEDQGLKDPKTKLKRTSIFYDYADERGQVLFRVERRAKGAEPPFLQHGPDGRGGFHSTRGCMQGVRKVPYRLPELSVADPKALVFVCEGEKDVDRLHSLGLTATTNPGGACKFTSDLARYLAGRRVVALADNDDAGEKHVALVMSALERVAARVSVLKLPGLPPKGDVSDWLDQGGSVEELKRLGEAALHESVETFPIADLRWWAAHEPEPRTWALDKFVPQGEVTLFTGPGGVGKSLFAQQLSTCFAAAIPMLGADTAGGAALYVTAEDDDRELHWRQAHIARALRMPIDRLAGKLHLSSLRGRLSNELATFDGEGRLRRAPAFGVLRATIETTGAKLVVLDNLAHLFAGSENDRGQVTAFANLLSSLCRDLGTTVILVGHPNKNGDDYSGSTAWLNAVRSQISIKRPDNALDPDSRILTLGKANYARHGEELSFRWHDFALVRDEDLAGDQRAEIAANVAANADNALFLTCLAERTRQKRAVSEKSGKNFAPAVFSTMPESKRIGKARLEAAMDRLFRIGAIERAELWRGDDRKLVYGLREVAGNGAGNAAQTPCANAGNGSANPQKTVRETQPTHTLPLEGEAGAAFQSRAPALQEEIGLKRLDWSAFDQRQMNGGPDA